MASFRVSVSGVKEVAQKLKASKAEFARAFAAGLCSGALIVCNKAKDGAPYKTGNLKRSIHIGVLDESGNLTDNVTEKQTSDGAPTPFRSMAMQRLVDLLERREKGTVSVGTDVEYGPAQEYLSERMGGGTHGSNKGPFLRPALDTSHDEVKTEVKEATIVALEHLTAGRV